MSDKLPTISATMHSISGTSNRSIRESALHKLNEYKLIEAKLQKQGKLKTYISNDIEIQTTFKKEESPAIKFCESEDFIGIKASPFELKPENKIIE
jgi:hypothetical protein